MRGGDIAGQERLGGVRRGDIAGQERLGGVRGGDIAGHLFVSPHTHRERQ